MDLSSPKLKKILIFAAIFTVIVFIFVKIWRRSYYSYPNDSEDAQVPITAMVSGTPAGSVTVTAAGHKFKAGDIVLLKNTGTTAITATTGVMPTVTLTAASGTPVIVATTTTPGTTFTFLGSFTGTFSATGSPTAESVGYGVMDTLKKALVTCQDAYARDMINATSPAAITAAADTRIKCIGTAVAPYTRGHCQWLPQKDGDPIPVPPSGDAQTAYTAYQTDIKNIQLAYVSTANRAAAGTFSGIADQAKANMIVSAARAADISGATQKYLATVCPGFYQPGDPTLSDPSPGYKLWTAVLGATGVTADPLVASTQKHFWAPSTGITDAAILNWAQYARTVTFVANTGLSATYGYLSAAPNGVGNISGTTYTDKSGNGGSNTENWRSAYVNGPGTFPAPTWK
jgi:hypothetical protein